MTFPENPAETVPQTETSLEDLQRSVQSLRALLNIVLVILLVLTGSLFLFLLREVSHIRRQTRELTQFVENYEKNSLPAMLEFRNKLQEFSQTHPDFKAILARYMGPSNSIPGRAQGNAESDDANPARMPVMPVK
jgi:hypothetical protein